MDSIVSTAIIGTGQVSNQEISTGTPIDTLTAHLSAGGIERKLLLTAGSLAIYQQAGRTPEQGPEPPHPANPESIPACPAKVAHLLEGLFQGGQRELLPEALHRLKQAGQRLPYELLPLALGYGAQSKEIRPALFAVLGERGRWLSRFEKTWAWVTQCIASELDDQEGLWQEGTLGQRCQLLAHLRSIEPTKARKWLMDVWKKEKAEARAELLTTLQTGLSSEDEPFLEKALDDRSEAVRDLSAGLLARIPDSAFMQRMLARADAMLTYAHGTFSITLPTDIDASWQRDGIEKPSNRSTDPQIWYARQVLALIPPTHWEECFSISPSDIIATLAEAIRARQDKMLQATSKSALIGDEEETDELLIECWSYAATLFDCPQWIEPLWTQWCKNPDTYTIRDTSSATIYQTLGKRLPVGARLIAPTQEQLERYQSEQWALVVSVLPAPWSKDFGDACLAALRTHILELDGQSYPSGHWQMALTSIALSLPSACFEAALAPWQFPEHTTWQMQQWKNQLKTFMAFVRKRQHLHRDINTEEI